MTLHSSSVPSSPPLVAHVIHHLHVGGLENGLVNLINRMPREHYRHAIVCMTDYSDFKRRLRHDDIPIFAMQRGQVPLARVYFELYRLFRTLRPAIVHTRGLSGLDALLPARCAGVPVLIHGEHGRDMDDLHGTNPKHRRLKRMFRPLVTQYTAVSRELAEYVNRSIGVPAGRVCQICNGVDTEVFHPSEQLSSIEANPRPAHADSFTIGTIGRLQPVKDQVTLVKAFAAATDRRPEIMEKSRLLIVGEGPSRQLLEDTIAQLRLQSRVELLGSRDDVPDLLRAMDLFVLPSLAEGISNTILEAMATGIPVIATRVGGNADLVEDARTGYLVDTGDWNAIAERILQYASAPEHRALHGRAARARALREFSLDVMVRRYRDLYDSLRRSQNASAKLVGP